MLAFYIFFFGGGRREGGGSETITNNVRRLPWVDRFFLVPNMVAMATSRSSNCFTRIQRRNSVFFFFFVDATR